MANLTVTLKTVTPMFMAGADGKTPELRAPSIKGMMRFWWRAMHGHLSIENLQKEEVKIFGGSGEKEGRSSFSLRISEFSFINKKISLTPHHNDKYCSEGDTTKACTYKNGECTKAIKRSGYWGSFTIRLASKLPLDNIENLFKITIILGGFGKRSRRGFGSIEITNINGDEYKPDYSPNEICKLLNSVVANGFKANGNKIERNATTSMGAYPYIKEIEIGSACNDYDVLLKKIGKASHEHPCCQKGFISPYRFASPIYVSIFKDDKGQYLPIITTLNCAFKGQNSSWAKKDKSQDFKKAILL